jgi:hypothetical protein
MLSVRCKVCNKELISSPKLQCCGCPNMTTVVGEKITAVDLSKVLLLNSEKKIKNNAILTSDDLKYQEDRRKRKVRKLHFEER